MSSFLQTKEWMDFQESLGREVFSIEGNIRGNIIKHGLPLGKNYLYIPYGPEIDFNAMTGGFDDPVRQLITQLKSLATEEGSMFVKAEPMNDSVAQMLVKHGFKKSEKEIQPHKTVVLDLEQTLEELLTRMHHKTRYNIKVAEKHGIRVQPSRNVDEFLNLLKKTTERDRFSSHGDDYYKKLLEAFESGAVRTELVLAYYRDKPAAGVITLRYGEQAYYLHGASDHKYRSFMAPYLLHWGIIKELKENGFKSYDLWGIDANKWPGVTRFKFGWGGRQVEYPGSFDLPVSDLWYLLYRIYREVMS